jgi:hypothetical protein
MAEKITDLPGLSNWDSHNRVTVDGVQYTPSELEKSRNKSVTTDYVDPYKQLGDNASSMTSSNAPKVDISDGKVRVYAPQSVLDSPYVEQLKKELQSLTGANLSDPGVIKAVNSLNEEIQTNWQNSLIQQTTGWSPEEYKDYQYALQTVTTTNPLKSSNLLKGKDKDGKIIKKTPQEWVDYWRSIYNTDERVQALLNSMKSKDPYERTMALVLNQGGDKNVYGFDSFERLGQAFGQAKNQWDKLKEGLWRKVATDNNTKEVEERARNLKISSDTLAGLSQIDNEEKFNRMKDSIKGKTWSELSDEQKAFVLELGVSKQDSSMLNNRSNREIMKGLRVPNKIGAYEKALDDMSSDNETNSRLGIDNILAESSYDKFRKTSDGFVKAKEYDDKNNENDLRLAQNAIMSGTEQNIGAFGGTAARFLTEALLLKAATGGAVNVGNISEALGGKMVQALAKHGLSPVSRIGQNVLSFAANLAGTIPEDILQTSLDNVLTYNEAENEHLLDPGQMSENLKSNFIVMSLFNVAKAGMNSIKRARLAKQLAQQADMNQVINIEGISADVDDLTRAVKNGGEIKVDSEKVSVTDADGNTKVLKNITPEQGKMIQQVRATDSSAAEATYYSKTGINDQNRALSEIPSDLQHRWFENGDVDAREQIADILKDNVEIRNASINRLYEDYVYWQNAIDSKPLDFNEWLNTDMAMYRYSTPSLDGGNETLSYSIVPGGLTGFGGEGQIIVIKPKDTLGRPQLAGYPKENEVFVSRDVAENSKPKLGSYENAVLEENILRGKHDGKRAAAMRALTSREIDVWSSKELNDGDRIFTSSKEADELYGHNNVKKHRVKLDEVEWGDTGHGTYKKAKFEIPELETPKAEAETTKTTLVGEDTPNGRNIEEVPDYDFTGKSHTDILNAEVRPTMLGVKHFVGKAYDAIMQRAKTDLIGQLHNKFGDVEVSDFDWVRHQSQNGVPLKKIIGSEDPTTHRIIDQNKIDAMKWWADQPLVKDLRKASRESLGKADDKNYLGYLPQTDYDPTNLSYEEALNGVGMLWEHSTGKSVMKDGKYVGYGGTFEGRYGTFVKNMLWDARKNDLAVAKLIDEVRMDGQEITPEVIQNARRAVDGEKNIQKLVNDSDSTKALVKALESTTEDSDGFLSEMKKIDADTKKQAEKSGLGQAIHDNYGGVYYGADSKNVSKQSGIVANNFDTLGNTMKNTVIEGVGSLYDNGGADLVYALQNAIDIVNRYMREGGDFREMLQEYVENHSHRSPEYAEEVVDKCMGKLGEVKGPLTKAKVIQTLSNSMKWEAMTRLKRWLTLAKYDQFNASTRKTIDRFLFNHMQMDSIKYNPTIRQRLTKGLNDLTSLRYRALFYGNIKNALLQTSELNRYFSSFKWGDVATMAKRLATDEGFRARVDDYVQSVAPMTSQLKADIYQSYSDIADSMKVEKDGVTFKDLGNKAKATADTIGLAPIEAAEAFKNRMMVAGLVQEADRLGLTGDEALRHIRNRFERVALAADEMGKIGMASNPLAKTMLFLQNFQIRELGMHLYNIKDATGMAKTTPKKVLAATNYLTKVFGAKLATTLILARLGYSASQTMGIDPFGLLDQYNQLDREDMELPDYFFMSPLFSGGMTSLISDMYFMARKAYEDSNQETVSEEAEQKLEPSWGLALPDISWDNVMGAASNFAPGSVFANRIGQMNEMMDTGWATSATGNKMYTAPNDALNTVLGYLFGRSATQNAQQYRQTYGDNLWQTLGRFNPFREYTEFDPIDTKNYTDWFKGDANDKQQFEKGRRYFQNERDRIIDTYESIISKSYASDDEIAEAKNNMNTKLEELYNKLERFVDAYERKNGTIDSSMVKPLINLLNTGRKVLGDTAEEANQRSLDEYNKALGRYSALGLSPVGTYSGANKYDKTAKTKYQGSPQWRTTSQYAKYGAPSEAVNVLKEADKTLAPIRKEIANSISDAYNRKDYDEVENIQQSYLREFDQVVSPIIAAYGNGIFGSTDVVNQIKDMLSTGTNSRSGNLIPSDQYRKDKYGRYRSMPFETVDVKKWAQQRFSNKLYKNPTSSITSTADEDIDEIKRLSSNGQNSRARAKALQLKVRVDNQTRSLNNEQYKWLNNFIEGGK